MRLLGRGAHGVVYLKQDSCTAVKRMAVTEPDKSEYGVSVTVMRELHILEEMLPHPHVVRYIGKLVHDGLIYIEMEFLPISLQTLMKGRLSEKVSRTYARHILLGLQHCHDEMKIVHRDLKPENLLVGLDGNLKLADFGLSRSLLCKDGKFDPMASGKYTPQMVTLWYRSREVLVGENYGVNVDMWSVGCIVYEMVQGHVLFKGQSEMDMIKQIDALVDEESRQLNDRSLIRDADAMRFVEFTLGRPSRSLCASSALKSYAFVSKRSQGPVQAEGLGQHPTLL